MDGILLIDKGQNATSFDVVAKIRKICNIRQVGHTGTLDPMATGLLCVLVGRAVKACEYVSHDEKSYLARVKFGEKTDTGDVTGKTLEKSEKIPSYEELCAVLPSFVGEISQIPPMYSALKIDGHKLCDLARQGVEVQRPQRKVNIFRLEAGKTEEKDVFTLDATVSGGTYIRTLCEDIGSSLGTFGTMASLRRVSLGGFDVKDAISVEELSKLTESGIESRILPTETLFSGLETLRLDGFFENLCKNGCEIYLKKIGAKLDEGQRVRLYGSDGFFALGEIKNYENGLAVKSIKRFDIKNS